MAPLGRDFPHAIPRVLRFIIFNLYLKVSEVFPELFLLKNLITFQVVEDTSFFDTIKF
jgi:hypothetical protein